MRFVEFTDMDGLTISIDQDAIDIVRASTHEGFALIRMGDVLLRVKGTRADVVAKLEATSGPEIHGRIEELEPFECCADPECQRQARTIARVEEWERISLDGIDKTESEHEEGWWETSKGAAFGLTVRTALKLILHGEVYAMDKERATVKPCALPTEPGFYEYRWKGISDPQDWIAVQVARVGDSDMIDRTVLVVLDPNTENMPALNTYSNAEWRKRETPE